MAEKARQILRAAEKLFASGRYHEVTLDEICRQAGVGKGTVYRYFEDKENLYYQVILAGLDELVASVEEVGRQEEAPGEGLRRVVLCMADFYRRRKALFSLMWSEQLRSSARKGKLWKQWRRRADKMLDVATEFISSGSEGGLYELGSFSPGTAGRLLMGMVRVGLWPHSDMSGVRDWPLAVVELFERGILRRNDK